MVTRYRRFRSRTREGGFPIVRPRIAVRLPHGADLPIHGSDDCVRQPEIGFDGKGEPFAFDQAFDSVVADRERLDGLAAIRRIEGVLERLARSQFGKELQGVQEVALSRRVGSEQDSERRHGDLDIVCDL